MRSVAYLPLGVQFALGRGIGALLFYTLRSRRHIASVNVSLCFPELDENMRRTLVRAIFRSMGISAVETALAFFRNPDSFRAWVTVEGLEHLESARSQGRGVLLAGAHFATLDFAGALLSLFADFDVMYRPSRNPVIELVARTGRERLYKYVVPREDLKGAIRCLKEGRTLWYAADQDYGAQHSVFAPFFDVSAATITITSRLARVNDSPVVFYSHFRDPVTKRWLLRLRPMDSYPTGDDLADATRLNAVIEGEIRTHPAQYYWLHRRFKTRPPGEDGLYRAQPHRHRRARQRSTVH
jgi:KDO2-lipid IV(A) lauroyltransferase